MNVEKKKQKSKYAKDTGYHFSTILRSHFFYESEGERSISPEILIEDGIFLWHEQATIIPEDMTKIWSLAEKLLESTYKTSSYSSLEFLRFLVVCGVLVPDDWNKQKPYPYSGMLLSAIYFQEARRLCEKSRTKRDRVWHIIAIAYYHLGLNTTPSTTQTTSKAASAKHDQRNTLKINLALQALEKVKEKTTPKDKEEAIEKVIDYIKNSKSLCDELSKIEPNILVNENTKISVLDRLKNSLIRWSAPKSNQKAVRKAFSEFSRRKAKLETSVNHLQEYELEMYGVPEGVDDYVRIFNRLKNGEFGVLSGYYIRGDD